MALRLLPARSCVPCVLCVLCGHPIVTPDEPTTTGEGPAHGGCVTDWARRLWVQVERLMRQQGATV